MPYSHSAEKYDNSTKPENGSSWNHRPFRLQGADPHFQLAAGLCKLPRVFGHHLTIGPLDVNQLAKVFNPGALGRYLRCYRVQSRHDSV